MNAPAAIRATFSDFRLVKGRKVAQLVYEVPIELADAALRAMGGVPTPESERWVGIARITDEASQEPEGDSTHPPPHDAGPEPRPTRPFHTLPLAQQAALKCRDSMFCQFMKAATPEQAAIRVREECGVRSRAEIEANPAAAARWQAILSDFDQWQRGYR